MRKRIASLSLLAYLASAQLCRGQENELERRVRAGIDAIYRLDYVGAESIYQQIVRERPDNPVGYGMLALTAWHQLLFASRNHALHNYAVPSPFYPEQLVKRVDREHGRFFSAVDRLLKVCDRRLSEDPSDDLALYFKGVAYENLAIEAQTLSKQWGKARSYAKRAKNIHEEVLNRQPGFIDANTSIAVQEYIVAVIPWRVRWLVFLIGFRGDRGLALRRLQLVAEKGLYRSLDAQAVIAFLEAWKGDPYRAIKIFEALKRRYPENFLSDINLATVYDLRLNDYRSALKIYEGLLQELSQKAPGLMPGELYYRIGLLYLKLHDNVQALGAFEKSVTSPQGEAETMPLASFEMAKLYEASGKMQDAQRCYRSVLSYSGNRTVLEKQLRTASVKLQTR